MFSSAWASRCWASWSSGSGRHGPTRPRLPRPPSRPARRPSAGWIRPGGRGEVAQGPRVLHLPPRDHDRLGAGRGEEPGVRRHGRDPGGRGDVDQGPARKDIDLPRDTPARAGAWSTRPALYLSVMAQAVPKQDAVSADDLQADRRAPACGTRRRTGRGRGRRRRPRTARRRSSSRTRSRRCWRPWPWARRCRPTRRRSRRSATPATKAAAWLAKAKPTDTTQAAALRLLVKVRAGEPAKALQPEIDQFLGRQNKDGGWGQLKDAASDAYATGQALYVLSLAGVKADRAEVRRGGRVPGRHARKTTARGR